RRIILEHDRLFSFAREQFDGNPALTAIVRLAPPPSGEALVLLSHHNALTRGNAYRVGILHLVLPPDPDFIVRFFHERYPAVSNWFHTHKLSYSHRIKLIKLKLQYH